MSAHVCLIATRRHDLPVNKQATAITKMPEKQAFSTIQVCGSPPRNTENHREMPPEREYQSRLRHDQRSPLDTRAGLCQGEFDVGSPATSWRSRGWRDPAQKNRSIRALSGSNTV